MILISNQHQSAADAHLSDEEFAKALEFNTEKNTLKSSSFLFLLRAKALEFNTEKNTLKLFFIIITG